MTELERVKAERDWLGEVIVDRIILKSIAAKPCDHFDGCPFPGTYCHTDDPLVCVLAIATSAIEQRFSDELAREE